MKTQRNYRGDRNYWKHEETGEIYITFGTTRESVNLSTGQRQTLKLVNFFNFIKLSDETIEKLESYFNPDSNPENTSAQSIPSRTPQRCFMSYQHAPFSVVAYT
jgi:hypothetical protein